MTVLGPISPDALGFTDMHEHVMMDGGWVLRQRHEGQLCSQDDRYSVDDPLTLSNVGLVKRNFMSNWDALSLDDEKLMLGELQDYKKSGGNAILELSVPGIRHKVSAIKRLSQASGVHIIISTGLYTSDSWSSEHLAMSKADMRQFMLDEIGCGVKGTGIRPGHIKIALHDLNINEERALRAAAEVANRTEISLTVHCSSTAGGDGRLAVKILKEEGVDLSRVVIAHAGGRFGPKDVKALALHPEMMKLSLDYSKELLDLGVNIGLEFYTSGDEPEWLLLAGVIALLRQGYSNQMVLGTDTCAKIMTRRGGGEGYCRLTCYAIPMLRKLGVSDYDIRMMTERNPARILAYKIHGIS